MTVVTQWIENQPKTERCLVYSDSVHMSGQWASTKQGCC